jgi:hypothetical protein
VDVLDHLSEVEFNELLARGQVIVAYDYLINKPAGKVPNGRYAYKRRAGAWVFAYPDSSYEQAVWHVPAELTFGLSWDGAVLHQTRTVVHADSGRIERWFIPVRKLNWAEYLLWRAELAPYSPVRRVPEQVGPYNVMTSFEVVEGETVLQHHAVRDGSFTCYTLDDTSLSALLVYRDGVAKPSPGGAAVALRQGGDAHDRTTIAAWLEIISIGYVQKTVTLNSAPFVPREARSYTLYPAAYEDDEPPMSRQIMNNIVSANLTPKNTPGNQLAAGVKRLVEVRTAPTLTPFITKVMEEFVMLLVPDGLRGQGTIATIEEVIDAQPDPSRARRLFEASEETVTPTAEAIFAFLKREAYGTAKDPRIICPFSQHIKLVWSAVLMGLEQTIKFGASGYTTTELSPPFYASGVAPAQVTGRVAEIMSHAENGVLETDLHRMDGTNNIVTRTLERMLIRAVFAGEELEMAMEWHKLAYNNKIRLGPWVFDQMYARASGERGTSFFNTTITAFTSFLGFRMDGMSAARAYARLGAYCGDDGITPDLSVETFTRAAEATGLRPEATFRARGSIVEFLARLHGGEVWYGEPNSMCDPYRVLQGLPVTANKTASPAELIGAKCYGLVASDLHTPVIGELAQYLLQQTLDGRMPDERLLAYSARMALTGGAYVNFHADWMEEVIAERLGHLGVEAISEHIRNRGEWSQFPTLEEESPPKAKVEAVVDGEHFDGETRDEGEEILRSSGKAASKKKQPSAGVSRRVCRHFLEGKCDWGDKCRFAHTNQNNGATTCADDRAGSSA